MDIDKRAESMKKLHEDTRATIEAQVQRQASRLNKNKKPMILKEGDLVWLHLRKERFPEERNSKLKPRGDGPFKVLKRINDNAYVIDIPQSKYLVSNSFNVSDLSPYHGDEVDEMQESRTTLSQGGGGDDTAHPTDDASSTPPSGPMTRARAKAIHDKVNSFLSMHYLDPTLDGSLPHSNALCVLSYVPQDRLHGCMEDGLKTGREDGQDEEGEAEISPPVLPAKDRYYRPGVCHLPQNLNADAPTLSPRYRYYRPGWAGTTATQTEPPVLPAMIPGQY